MKQVTDLVHIESQFQYTGSTYDSLEQLQRNILDYQLLFEDMEWTKEELKHISEQLVITGRIFAEQQGFSSDANYVYAGWTKKQLNSLGDPDGLSHPERLSSNLGPTGRLYHGIKSEVEGNNVRFYNDARNDRGQAYAGHMEYGFHDRGGNLVPARPFMRPALYAVSEASKGNFRSIMTGLLNNMWTQQGFHGVSMLDFGHKKGSQSMFWKSQVLFPGKLAQLNRLKEVGGKSFRQKMTSSNFARYGRERKIGFNIRKNQKDYNRLTTPKNARYAKNKWGRRSGRTNQMEKERARHFQNAKNKAEETKRKLSMRRRLQATGQWDDRYNRPKSEVKEMLESRRRSSLSTKEQISAKKTDEIKSSKQSNDKNWDSWLKDHKKFQEEKNSYYENNAINDDYSIHEGAGLGYSKDYIDMNEIYEMGFGNDVFEVDRNVYDDNNPYDD